MARRRKHYNTVQPYSSLSYRPLVPEAILPPVPRSGIYDRVCYETDLNCDVIFGGKSLLRPTE